MRIMRERDPALSDKMHKFGERRPYSMFTIEQENDVAFRFSALNDDALMLLEMIKRTRVFNIWKVEGGVAALDVVEHDDVSINNLTSAPPARYRMLLASPATYKRGNEYRNIFALPYLLRSVVDKLKQYEGVDVTFDQVNELCEHVSYDTYRLQSDNYQLKPEQPNKAPTSGDDMTRGIAQKTASIKPIAGMTGEMVLSMKGTREQKAMFAMLLRYAAFTGLGAKTALGMGGILLDEQ
jgi:CRISPR-associated endoribonuclease Cas6